MKFEDRIDFHITEVETKKYEDVQSWWTNDVARRYKEEVIDWGRIMAGKVPDSVAAEALAAAETGPSGPGWVIQFRGYHYFNNPERPGEEGSNHVRKYLTSSFMGWDENGKPKPVVLPDPTDATTHHHVHAPTDGSESSRCCWTTTVPRKSPLPIRIMTREANIARPAAVAGAASGDDPEAGI